MLGYLKKVFLIVGISFLATAVYLAYDVIKFRTQAVTTAGTVTSSGAVQFAVQEYNYYYHSIFRYPVGSVLTIAYSTQNPDAAKIDTLLELWLVPIIFALLGLVLVALGYRRADPFDWRVNGEGIMASFVRLKKTKLGQVVVCQWHNPADGKKYTFESSPAQIDPQKLPEDKKVSVYIDRANPNKYWVDLSFLGKND